MAMAGRPSWCLRGGQRVENTTADGGGAGLWVPGWPARVVCQFDDFPFEINGLMADEAIISDGLHGVLVRMPGRLGEASFGSG
jgi:hypothetical protein